MKKPLLLLVLCFLAACNKKDNNTTVAGGTLPGSGTTMVKNYTGAINFLSGCGQTCTQTVTVMADVIDDPTDRITVILCKFADCNTTIPTTVCATLPVGSSTPCQTQIPTVNIVLGKQTVGFIDAWVGPNGAGYSNYFIHEEVTR